MNNADGDAIKNAHDEDRKMDNDITVDADIVIVKDDFFA